VTKISIWTFTNTCLEAAIHAAVAQQKVPDGQADGRGHGRADGPHEGGPGLAQHPAGGGRGRGRRGRARLLDRTRLRVRARGAARALKMRTFLQKCNFLDLTRLFWQLYFFFHSEKIQGP
jgi:hypothetical protein